MALSKDPRIDAWLARRIWIGGLLLALSACGRPKADPTGPDSGVTPDALGGDVVGGATGQTGGKASGGGAGAAGDGGAAGTAGAGGASPTVPALDIAGRWGMFAFEDPVGVRLKQAADGTLTGEGCAAGAPGSSPPGLLFLCGPISGRVTGRTAWFEFPLQDMHSAYRMEVTISTDGRRMAGTFHILRPTDAFHGLVDYPLDYPVALQRVRDDAVWLDQALLADSPIEGRYDLTLIPAASDGAEFVAGKTYRFSYWQRASYGDLGSFWNNEISPLSQGSPLRVGPVPATVPGLPTALTLDFEGAAFTTVTATTASGGHYRFAAKKMTAP